MRRNETLKQTHTQAPDSNMKHNEPTFEAMEITKTNTKMETKKGKKRDKKERGNRQRPQRLGLMSS